MTDNTPFSVRMDPEDKERLLELIKESGRNNKEFMGVLLNSYDLNKAKIEIPDIAQDIDGLQALTSQINDYYVNIGKRIQMIRNNKDIEFTKETNLYKEKIEQLINKSEKADQELASTRENLTRLEEENKKMKEQLASLQESVSDKATLVDEYKEKNDTLAGLINEYKQFKIENDTLRENIGDTSTKLDKLTTINRENEATINRLTGKIKDLETNHQNELVSINEKHEEEMGMANAKFALKTDQLKLEMKLQQQEQLQENQNKYNQEIEAYQQKYKDLLDQLQKRSTENDKTDRKGK